MQLSEEVKSLLYRLGETPENFTGCILFMLMFNDISCGTKDNGEAWRTGCCWNSPKADVLIFRATTPFSRGQLKSEGHGKLSIHFAADQETTETIFV